MLLNQKKVPFALVIFLLASILAACGAGDGDLPETEDDVLVYASFQPFGVDADVKLAIEIFNETHTDVQIEIRDYWGSDYDEALQGRQQMLTEFSVGNIPDILDLGFNCWNVPMLPYKRLVEQGYLENLWPYIENDPELGREAVVDAPLKLAETGGGLYLLFGSFSMKTLAGPERIVGDRMRWTLAEQRKAFAAMPEDSTVLGYFFEKDDVLQTLLSMVLDGYVNWETGSCSFDSQSFRAALEFVKGFPDEVPWPSNEAVSLETLDRQRSGLQMLDDVTISNLLHIQLCDVTFGEKTSFVGYPVEDGGIGSAFAPASTRLAISSACKNKEAAWEIVRQLILPKYTDTVSPSISDVIPINRSDYQLMNASLMDPDRNVKETMRFIDGSSYEFHAATEEDLHRFEDLLYSIERISLYDGDIAAIVTDQCGPYLAGDKSLDETVELIQRRVSLYVNEQR